MQGKSWAGVRRPVPCITMRSLLEQKARAMDRAALLFLVGVNVAALSKLPFTPNMFIGAMNGILAAALLATSVWSPRLYIRFRQVDSAPGARLAVG